MALVFPATAALLAIAVAVLLWPATVEFVLTKDANAWSVAVRARLRWLGIDVPLHRPSPPTKKARSPARPPGHRDRRISALLRSPGFVARSTRLLRELAVLARPEQFHLHARVGFEDPSDTGMLLGSFAGRSLGQKGIRIHLEPDFADEVLEGRLRVCWSRSIAALLWPLVKYLASPVVWRALRNYQASGSSVPGYFGRMVR